MDAFFLDLFDKMSRPTTRSSAKASAKASEEDPAVPSMT